MKNKILLYSWLSVCALSSSPLRAEVGEANLQRAIDVLAGRDSTQSQDWAVQQLQQACDSIPFAHHILGMHYKYAEGGQQDFRKAYEHYSLGAEQGDAWCCYDCGFMKYKGLGTTQSYTEAVDYFQRAAEGGHAEAIYMLGLCYRNGFGVEPDAALCHFFLNMAAEMGSTKAADELLKELPENEGEAMTLANDLNLPVGEKMLDIVPYVPLNKRVLAGSYEGVLVTYDWSGEWALAEKKITLDMAVNAETATGFLASETDSIGFVANVSDDGTLAFNHTESALYERYSPDFYSRFRFDEIAVNYRNGILTGRLRLYSLDEQEPGRPMYIALRHTAYADGSSANDENDNIVAYASPETHTITLKFELPEDVPNVGISFYNQNTLKVAEYQCGAMEVGIKTLTLNPSLDAGYYAIRVWAGGRQYQTIIII